MSYLSAGMYNEDKVKTALELMESFSDSDSGPVTRDEMKKVLGGFKTLHNIVGEMSALHSRNGISGLKKTERTGSVVPGTYTL